MKTTIFVDQELISQADISGNVAIYVGIICVLLVISAMMSGSESAFFTLGPKELRFDEYPFIFLTLLLSLQASYAAPLILLAQNRQADRDRVTSQEDRARDERNLAVTEFMVREIAAMRKELVAEIKELMDEKSGTNTQPDTKK